LARSIVTFDQRGDEFVPFWRRKLAESAFLSSPGLLFPGLER